MDTNININTPDFKNQYQCQYQYLSFENSITIPILKNLEFKNNRGLNTKVLQYSECKLLTENPMWPSYRQKSLVFYSDF